MPSNKKPRYKITIENHGLGEYESNLVSYTFDSSSPKDAIRRVERVKDRCYDTGKRIPYKSQLYLEALAISALTDLEGI